MLESQNRRVLGRTIMKRKLIYKRKCNYCGKNYEGYGEKYCSSKCSHKGKSVEHSKPIAERFWSKVDIKGKDECWEWKASRIRDRYGKFDGGKLAHRISYEMSFGKIAEGLYVCHKCDNPPCVNPNHLFLGTQQDNVDDMLKKDRLPTGIKHPKSKFTDEQILEIKKLRTEGIPISLISEQFNISKGYIYNLCNGISRPRTEQVHVPKFDTSGINKPNSKLNDEKVIEIRRLHKEGIRYIDLSKKFNVSISVIGNVVRNETWKHVK